MQGNEEQLNETMSFASFMNVSELRSLYYGRRNMYVAFTDDEHVSIKGDAGIKPRPTGNLLYRLEDVIGRRVGTPLFYCAIFRYEPSSIFVPDIRKYTISNFQLDVNVIRSFGYMTDLPNLEYLIDDASAVDFPGSDFSRFWTLTQNIADALSNGSDSEKIWRQVILDIGYSGFQDVSGESTIIHGSDPCTIALDVGNVDLIDILPIQKYRKDKRDSVQRRINTKLKYLWVERNLIAKEKTPRKRNLYGDSPKEV